MKTQNKKANYEKMFRKYEREIHPVVEGNTLQEIEIKGKQAVANLEVARADYESEGGRGWGAILGAANDNVKILRCAWYAKRYGWVR